MIFRQPEKDRSLRQLLRRAALGMQQAPLLLDEPVALQLALYMESHYCFE
ncbi:hypothetical protein ACIPIN_05785 [Pseudomonas sp. NPDC087697]